MVVVERRAAKDSNPLRLAKLAQVHSLCMLAIVFSKNGGKSSQFFFFEDLRASTEAARGGHVQVPTKVKYLKRGEKVIRWDGIKLKQDM